MTPAAFGRLIYECRKIHGWSSRRVAREVGVSPTRMNELERGISRTTGKATLASEEVVRGLADLFDLPADFLMAFAGYTSEYPWLDPGEQ